MRFFRSIPGAIVVLACLALAAGLVAVGIQVHAVIHPPRTSSSGLNLATGLVDMEDVSFKAPDGITLSGWLVRGRPDKTPIVVCHDAGESRVAAENVAIFLHGLGHTVLAFDFRGHGASPEAACTFGIREKRDVLGAVDFLSSSAGAGTREIGVYGVGMGAYAAVLAAPDRPALKVLVLDGLYPDVAYPLVRRTYSSWPFGVRRLGFAPKWIFHLLTGADPSSERAADILPKLGGRSLLLVAPAGDSALANAMQALYAVAPQRKDLETNLVTLPATRTSGLFGDELERYHRRIAEFFETRLAEVRPTAQAGRPGA